MTDQTNGASVPVRKTTHYAFFRCNAQDGKLFAVEEGITLDEALCEASCLMAAAEDNLFDLAMSGDNPRIWAAAYLVEFAKAVLNAIPRMIDQGESHE